MAEGESDGSGKFKIRTITYFLPRPPQLLTALSDFSTELQKCSNFLSNAKKHIENEKGKATIPLLV